MQTYLFYDLETSGLSPAFDQVYQFAAIRTDMDLHEIERHEFLVKPTIDVIPTPEAMLIHRLDIRLLEEEGDSECEVIFKIHQLLNTPGTISLGYNTLNFDDEFLRFNFYRHLLTPYTHQFANQCRRMDLFPMVVFYYLGRRDHLLWGERDGQVSLKLEDLALKNQFSTGQAHNAMVDVEATVNLARKLKQDKRMWESLYGCFVKEEDCTRLAKLPLIEIKDIAYPLGIAVNGKFGSKKAYQAPVLGLGQHRHYKNQTIWLNLEDERILSGDNAIIPELWSIKKRPCEPPFIMQPKSAFNLLDADRKKLVEETLRFLQKSPAYFSAIQDYVLDFKFPVYQETDIDAALYMNGFWSDDEAIFMRRFWQSSATEKQQLAISGCSDKLEKLTHRYIGRFYRHLFHQEDEALFAAYLDRIWNAENSSIVDYQLKPRLIRPVALKRIAEIDLTLLDTEQKAVLEGLTHFLQKQIQ